MPCPRERATSASSPSDASTRQRRAQQRPQCTAPCQVAQPLARRIVQVGAAEAQPRRDALQLAAHLHRFLGEAHVRQRPRIGGLARITSRTSSASSSESVRGS
jgi:hypothetical protein